MYPFIDQDDIVDMRIKRVLRDLRVGLMVFPSFESTHMTSTAHGQRLEPSVLQLAPEGALSVRFIPVNDLDRLPECDVYLCSVYTRGWEEFKQFSAHVGPARIVAGGYHPTAEPEATRKYADRVVTGMCSNIEYILQSFPGIYKGAPGWRPFRRDLIDMTRLYQVYPDVLPESRVGSLVTSVGCPYDCAFCSTPGMSDRKLRAAKKDFVHEEIASLKRHGVDTVFVRDESFATHPNFEQIVEVVGAAKFRQVYSFGTAAALTDKKLDMLAAAKWHSLCLGLEDVGTRYRKNRDMADTCARIRAHGIGIVLSVIINDDVPFQQAPAQFLALWDALCELKPIQVAINFLMPFPGTGLWPQYKDRITEETFIKYDSKTPIFAAPEHVEWYRQMAVALQLAYYASEHYPRNYFGTVDTMRIRMDELSAQFDVSYVEALRMFTSRTLV